MEVLQRTANRGSISDGPYEIDNSLKFEPDNSEYIYRTPSSAGNRRTWTLSFWLKRTELGASMRIFEAWDGSTGTSALFTDADLFILDLNAGSNYFTSSAVFRDTSAWYHFVIRVDTTSGTASERARVYVNGSELAGSWNSNIGQNTDLTWNQNVAHNFARFHNNDSFVSGYYAEIVNVDGTSLAPTAFGEVDEDSGIWIPIDASPTYGTNGFKLEFKTAGGLGADTSGNGHTWTLNAIAAADQATDTPTNNFATWNVLANNAGIFTYTEGATKWKPTSGNWGSTTASLGFTKGKWYAEFKAASNVTNVMVGVQELSGNYVGGYSGEFANSTSEGYGYYNANGNVYNNGGNSSYGASFPLSVLVGVALDFKDDGTALMYISKDNVWQNSADPANGTGGYSLNSGNAVEGFFSFAGSLYQNNDFLQSNFGGYTVNSISSAASDANGYGTFEYAPPSGYYALCTKNLAEYG